MTHDELLAKVDLIIGLAEEQMGITGLNIHKALRAVVELHIPKAHLNDEDLWCDGCYPTNQTYPCPTIKVIKKELAKINKRQK